MDPQSKPYLCEGKICFTTAWHGRLFMSAAFMAKYGKFAMVVSTHGDGELLTSVIHSYGHETIRGSSRKKGFSAVIGIIKNIKAGTRIAITPDGPIGPRFKIKGGVCALAYKYKIPIIPISFSARRIKVLKTWDRFLIPIPFLSQIKVDIGAPINLKGVLHEDEAYLEQVMLEQVQSLDYDNNLNIDY